MSSSPVSPPSSRTRVLILIKGLGIGGAETLIAESASRWDRAAFDYRVVYLLPWKDQLAPRLRDAGVNVDCLDWRGPASMRGLQKLRELSRMWQPEIVHSHLPSAAVLARALVSNTAHVYTEHNIVDSYRQPTRSLNRLTYARNRAVIAVSDAVAQSIAGYPGPEPTVVPNGVSIEVTDEEVAAVRIELGLEPDAPLVVHVGNIRPYKGHSTLIEATKSVLEKIPETVVISIGGEKNEGDLEHLERASRAAGVNGRLRFLGRRDDARSFIAAADLVVNPSDVEGLPVSLLEALALGIRVVATDVGGVSSVVEHERTGLLVPSGQPESLAAAMVRSLTSPESEEWAAAGARRVRDQHSLSGMVASYEAIYRTVLDG